MKSLQILTLVSSALVLFGCASITNSKLQPVSVNAFTKNGDEVEDARCSLMNDKGTWYINTPGSVTIQKSYSDMVVMCRKKGMSAGSITVVSASNGGVWGNILAGGIIGYAVDASSGAGFDYPTMMNVEMGSSKTLGKPAPGGTAHQKANE